MVLAPGSRVGPYEVSAQIGAGGMGEVYRARDTKLNRDVALKILPDAFSIGDDRIARFRREAQVLASLNHPNIGTFGGGTWRVSAVGGEPSPLTALDLSRRETGHSTPLLLPDGKHFLYLRESGVAEKWRWR